MRNLPDRYFALMHHQERTLMIVLEIISGNDGDRQDCRITDVGKFVAVITTFCQQFIKEDKDPYNPLGVDRLLLKFGFELILFSGSQLKNPN